MYVEIEHQSTANVVKFVIKDDIEINAQLDTELQEVATFYLNYSTALELRNALNIIFYKQ